MYKVLSLLAISILCFSACDSTPKENESKIVINQSTKIPAVEINQDEPVESVKEIVVEKHTEMLVMTGEQVYQKSCKGCHASGAANAPKLGDVTAWKPRINKGIDALYISVLKGVPGTAMMAKGTCGTCSDDELRSAVDYMLSQAK